MIFNVEIAERFYDNGTLGYQGWFYNNKRHRVDGPAYLEWHANGTLYIEEWYIDDLYHRHGGPAYQQWYDNGILHKEGYWLYGIEINDAIKEWAIATGIKDIMMMTPEENTMFNLTWGNDV